MNLPAAQVTTYIEYTPHNPGKSINISSAIASLSATQVGDTNSPFRSYKTSEPPDLVLDTLESQAGYVVVAANSVADEYNRAYCQIWKLHKRA